MAKSDMPQRTLHPPRLPAYLCGGVKIFVSAFICVYLWQNNNTDMEHNKRNINKEVAGKLSRLFDVPIERFI